MGYSGTEIIERFAQFAGLPDGTEPGKAGRVRQRFPDGSGASLYYRRDTAGRVVEIQSYGSHFPLARLLLTKAGKRRLWLLNGDRWGGGGYGKTNDQNDVMRDLAQRSGTPCLIVPFSAMREAEILTHTITVVQDLPERWTPEDHSAATLGEVPERHRNREAWHDENGSELVAPRAGDGRHARPDNAGGWYVNTRTGGSWRQETVAGPAYEGRLDSSYLPVARGQDGRYHWTEERHWLGESVFRAARRSWPRDSDGWHAPVRYFLSAFDTNEPQPLYFLAELPARARPKTVAEAREALKPAEVADAELAGRTVLRQGDVFAIALPELPTRELPGPSRRMGYVLEVNHQVTEARTGRDGATYARGLLRHRPRERGRRPEHQTLNLGTTWHKLVKNTVPARRAWSLGGNVD